MFGSVGVQACILCEWLVVLQSILFYVPYLCVRLLGVRCAHLVSWERLAWVSVCSVTWPYFEYHKHSGCPSSGQTDENVEEGHQVIHGDTQCVFHNFCSILGLLYGTC
jgi:hypothetical protein